ncbi:MAG: sigma-54 dependent transcriptional regulator [Gammaproteobacteria bacterium]|nr:sigma-54 dependent transcriptional regulator [Gammaproteobacteria bacterium]
MSSGQEVLVVDDEPDIRELLAVTLERMGIDCELAATVSEARQYLSDQRFALCLTDMRLPDGNGIDLVRHIQKHHDDVPVAVITAYGSVDTAVEALKAGAFDFVSKPVQLEDLRNLVTAALKLSATDTKLERRSRYTLLGDSGPIREIRRMIAKVARSQAPAYIGGESGTGKELVARLIHEKSPRSDQPFVPVNCGAIPSELMESEFFGHKKGSFTGAVADKPGLFQAADGGTLFLDEVAELPASMQVKLLRAIQERAVRPVGAQAEVAVNVRILSATQENLAELVHEGRFRQDLYYRINVIELTVPPLRERGADVVLLAEYFLKRLSDGAHTGQLILSEEALAALEAYGFPGNVRELENTLERAIALCEGDTIEPSDLGLRDPAGESAAAGSATFVPGSEPLEDYLERIERDAVLEALNRTARNKTAAAKLLGISFRALRYKLEKLGID